MVRVPVRAVHYARNDPETHRGGVEAFARGLRLVFEDVVFAQPGSQELSDVRRTRPLVICDNHWVSDWPPDVPVVGFQHGVAAVKSGVTRSWTDRSLARRQAKAASRPNTVWVACAQWISDAFARGHGNAAEFVIHHPVDVDQFDGGPGPVASRLLLHDARGEHKGERLVASLATAFPTWTFAPLDCAPTDVANKMRSARAFLHLSRYEGNSMVCTEAMCTNLPCFFTDVGLMRDRVAPTDVWTVDASRAFDDEDYLHREMRGFLGSLEHRRYQPRDWVLQHARPERAAARWNAVAQRVLASWV